MLALRIKQHLNQLSHFLIKPNSLGLQPLANNQLTLFHRPSKVLFPEAVVSIPELLLTVDFLDIELGLGFPLEYLIQQKN